MTIRARLLIALPIALASVHSGWADPEAPPTVVPDRPALVRIIDEGRNIATPEGINVMEQVTMDDGDRQWISVRGRNRDNPVILFIHGGPGFPMMPYSWSFQSGWEDYFTVVQWDQRGVGKNSTTADRAKLAPIMSLDRTVSDAIGVIDHIRTKLGKQKVIVLGFSWGTIVGVNLIQKRPDLVNAYVAVGQVVLPEGEKVLFSETLKAARESGDDAAVTALQAMGPYPRPDGSRPWDIALKVRGYARQYDGLWYGQKDTNLLWEMALLASEYGDADVAQLPLGEKWVQSTPIMKDVLGFDNSKLNQHFKVPIIFLMGRYDLFTPWIAAKDWFGTIAAPKKKFITFDRSSHFVMIEEPGRFLNALITEALPLTEGSPRYAEARRVHRIAEPPRQAY
jgi:pimeloyl-ACP methyl ester carboxylesterase